MISRRKPIQRTAIKPSGKPIARRNAARKTYLKHSTKPLNRVNHIRKATNFARSYGSHERVAFVKTLACAACGVVGYSENAHVAPPSEKGTGYKAGFEWIAPLCGPRDRTVYAWGTDYYIGCHKTYDEYPENFHARFPDFDATKACADCEAAWLLEESE